VQNTQQREKMTMPDKTVDYQVTISVSVSPHETLSYNTLSFTRSYNIKAQSFTDVARKVDFLLEQVESVENSGS
jgi:hypothetical protein